MIENHWQPIFRAGRRFFPAIAFSGGFLWDSLTMGRVVSTLDLWVLVAYYLGAGVSLAIMAGGYKREWDKWFTLLLQFFFGGLFSALIIFYFKSSRSLGAFIVVGILVLMLVANEFLQDKYDNRVVSWALFCLSGTMYLNFLIPHIASSVNYLWFYVGSSISFIIVLMIWRLSSTPPRTLASPIVVTISSLFLYGFQVIPPVPLVLKQDIACKEFLKSGGEYGCKTEEQGLFANAGLAREKIHFSKGEKIYYLSSIFAPPKVKVDLEHRWWIWNKDEGEWALKFKLDLPMTGGREEGWRTYSYVENSAEKGLWKVETALKDGAVLGYRSFKLEPAEKDSYYKLNSVQLN